MKLKTLSIACLLLCISISAFAQLDKASNKALKKAEKYYKKKKYTESAKMLKPVLQKYPTNENIWSSYQEVNYQAYINNPMNRSEEHTSELQSQSTISYDVFCLKKKNNTALQPFK